MNPEMLQNLGLEKNLSQNDLNMMNQLFNSINNNKPLKMSAGDRNRLVNKLTKLSQPQVSDDNNLKNQKDIKDMDEEERKIYKEELRKKLKNKINEKKNLRCKSKNGNKINEVINLPSSFANMNLNPTINNLDSKTDIISSIHNTEILDTKISQKEEILNTINEEIQINHENNEEIKNLNNTDGVKINNVDKINLIINKKYNEPDLVNNEVNEDIDDYLN